MRSLLTTLALQIYSIALLTTSSLTWVNARADGIAIRTEQGDQPDLAVDQHRHSTSLKPITRCRSVPEKQAFESESTACTLFDYFYAGGWRSSNWANFMGRPLRRGVST